jgi:Pyridoxamine 5'-phosphate oxidase
MGQQFPSIEDRHREFIEKQHIFFVATAAPEGRVSLSPKGMNSFRVLGANEVAYLDVTGSGSETAAHLRASPDGRMTIMFCAFDGPPNILRLYGCGQSLPRGSAGYAATLQHFDELPGARQIIRLAVDLVQTSCGMGVPFFDYKGDREALNNWAARQGREGLRKYWRLKNLRSIDGLATGFDPDTMSE